MLTIDPYATKVLQRGVHDRMVSEIDNVARDAHIEPKWIWTALKDTCSEAVFSYVAKHKFHAPQGVYGLCLHGKAKTDPTTIMSAMAGAYVRNFIRARVLSVGQVVEMKENGHLDDGITTLLIPNFFLGKNQGSSLASWKLTYLIDVLVERRLRGQQTVIYVSDLNALAEEYGVGFAQHIKTYFIQAAA